MRTTYRNRGKRIFDIVLVASSAPVWLPVTLILACIVRWTMGRPVFNRQQRAGLRAREFQLIKLRTMTDDRDADGNLLPDSVRTTRLGKFLRSSSLDELTELFNVLKGEMSLVGPRPLPTKYLPRYNAEQARRHDILPGVTGWAQVNGRNSLSWDEKFRLDLWYKDNVALWLDLEILWMTLRKVLSREDINQSDTVTMEEFKG
jgi:lipopolysaccharide/colanic/teichoic acid biosynthesis glycosyltransferase